MWHAYNLVALGDSVKSTTIRKVKDESSTGSSTASRVRTTLTISVENIEFDTSACELRLKGRNIQENQYVKVKYRGVAGNLFYFTLPLPHGLDGCLSHYRLAVEPEVHFSQAALGLCVI